MCGAPATSPRCTGVGASPSDREERCLSALPGHGIIPAKPEIGLPFADAPPAVWKWLPSLSRNAAAIVASPPRSGSRGRDSAARDLLLTIDIPLRLVNYRYCLAIDLEAGIPVAEPSAGNGRRSIGKMATPRVAGTKRPLRKAAAGRSAGGRIEPGAEVRFVRFYRSINMRPLARDGPGSATK